MPTHPSRRSVLGGLAAFSGLGIAPGLLPLARAQTGLDPDRWFVFCYFSGGWDLLLSLDPRDPASFGGDRRRITRIDTGFELLSASRRQLVPTAVPEMTFGPYIGSLAGQANRLAVVRGMSMDTLTHEVGRRRFITGIPPAGLQAKGSSFATVAASLLGADDPIPQLSVRVESYNESLPSWSSAIKVGAIEDLVRALGESPDGLYTGEQQAIEQAMEAFRAGRRSTRSTFLQDAYAARLAGLDLVSLGLDASFDFGADTAEMRDLRDRYGVDPADLTSAGAQAAAAVTAITTGISRCVSIVVAEDLDSHGPEWAGSHGPRLEAGFDTVAALIDDLGSRPFRDTEETWLDHTTVVVFSEFGRTALLNSSDGRDHHLHNACLLAGAGIRPGVYGRSSDLGMAPVPVDLATGLEQRDGGTVIKPEHVYRGLLSGMGVADDIMEYRAEPLTAFLT